MSQVFLVGDVHGCFYTLDHLLQRLSIQKEDQLVMIGDLVGKGPHTSLVLDKLIEMDADIVLGNHDLYFMSVMRLFLFIACAVHCLKLLWGFSL